MAVRVVGSRKGQMKFIILTIVSVVAILAIIVASLYFVNGMKNGYEKKLQSYEASINDTRRKVYSPKEDIKFNTILEESMFNISEVFSSIPQIDYLSEEDMGKLSIIDLKAGIPAPKYVVTDKKIPDDIREQEFNMLLLQSNLEKDDYVDVRIAYSSAEDFVVLAKKKVKDINIKQNTIWTWLNEKEILTMSCAIVDAYLHKGTKLYVTKYVQPSLQKDATTNYPVNNQVLSIMRNDPNIRDKAGLELSNQLRLDLEERLKNISPESLAVVSSGVNQESSKRSESVSQTEQIPQKAVPTQAAKQEVAKTTPVQNQGSNSNDNKGSVTDGKFD